MSDYLSVSTSRVKEGRFNDLRGDDVGNLCVVPPTSGIPDLWFLTESGDGLGNINFNGNYSVVNKDAKHVAQKHYEIYSFQATISDDQVFAQIDYGGIVGGLTNGLDLYINVVGVGEFPLLLNFTIKKNSDWFGLTPNVNLTQFSGTAQTLAVHIDIYGEYGIPLRLNPGDSFIVRLRDNFTSLTSQIFAVKGLGYDII